MPKPQNPVIVLPGITGTTLHDDYPLSTEDLWTMVLSKEFERLQLHPDDVRYETIEPAHVFPGRVFGAIYGDLIKALRYDLTDRADLPVPVFAFPYDWRHDLKRTAQRLRDFVEEVIARTRLLLPSYQGAVAAAAADANTDLFEADAWQPGVVASLSEYIRLHAVDPPRTKAQRAQAAKEMLQ